MSEARASPIPEKIRAHLTRALGVQGERLGEHLRGWRERLGKLIAWHTPAQWSFLEQQPSLVKLVRMDLGSYPCRLFVSPGRS